MIRALVAAIIMTPPILAAAQSAEQRVAEGDRAYVERDAANALARYESAIAIDASRYDALWKAARSSTDLGEFEPDAHKREQFFARARDYAERAVKANTNEAEAYFQLARAIGRVALAAGAKERVRLGVEVRQFALDAIARNPNHAGGLHVLGMWNAEVMRLNSLERMMAKTFLGGAVMAEANWNSATTDLEKAVAIEPARIVHHLDLAFVYKDTGKRDLARRTFEWIASAPIVDYNDANYKRQAADALRHLK